MRVLVADDHEIVREGLISLLSEEQAVEVMGDASQAKGRGACLGKILATTTMESSGCRQP